jgi:hypothetical protein
MFGWDLKNRPIFKEGRFSEGSILRSFTVLQQIKVLINVPYTCSAKSKISRHEPQACGNNHHDERKMPFLLLLFKVKSQGCKFHLNVKPCCQDFDLIAWYIWWLWWEENTWCFPRSKVKVVASDKGDCPSQSAKRNNSLLTFYDNELSFFFQALFFFFLISLYRFTTVSVKIGLYCYTVSVAIHLHHKMLVFKKKKILISQKYEQNNAWKKW